MIENSLTNCYKLISKIGEGSFSEVLKVRDLETGKLYAAKRLLKDFRSKEEVENYGEYKTLKKLGSHLHVLTLEQVVYDASICNLTLIFNLMDFSLYDFIKDRSRRLSEKKCKFYIYQLLQGVAYLHRNGIFHRDIKPENILLLFNKALAKSNPLKAELVQLGDLGSVATISCPQPRSEYISTRWYRAPECLLTSGYYGSKMDIWALGCCFFEMATLQPLFPGENELDQLHKIHEILGTPSSEMLKRFKHLSPNIIDYNFEKFTPIDFMKITRNFSAKGLDVLKKMLSYHPDNRQKASKLLQNRYFEDLDPFDSNDRVNFMSRSDSKIMRVTSLNSSFNGSRASVQSSKNVSNPNVPEEFTNTHIKRLEAAQKNQKKDLERGWNRNRPRDSKRETNNSNQNLINENHQKTNSHPTLNKPSKKHRNK